MGQPRTAERVNFTRARIDAIPTPVKRTYVYDAKVQGLAIVVQPSGSRSWYLCKRINGRQARIPIGPWPAIDVATARTLAGKMIADIADGGDPIAARRGKRSEASLGDVWGDFIKDRDRTRQPSTVAGYRTIWQRHIKATFNARSLRSITRQDVKRWYHVIGERSGKYAANRAAALLHAIFVFAADEDMFTGTNPARFKRGTKYAERSRERFLDQDEVRRLLDVLYDRPSPDRVLRWHQRNTAVMLHKRDKHRTAADIARTVGADEDAVAGWLNGDDDDALIDPVFLDLFAVLLFAGQRKGNTMAMRWADVDLRRGTWTIPGDSTKNHDAHLVTLSDPTLEILRRRHAENESGSVYVFPSPRTPSRPVREIKTAWHAVCRRAGLTDVRPHDLRRTLGSWLAQAGVSLQVIGKTLGHRSMKATEIYARLHDEAPRQAVGDAAAAMMAARNPDTRGVVGKIIG